MRKVIGMLGGIAVVSVALVAMAAEKSAGRTAFDQRESHGIERELANGLALENQRLPMMIDEDTRLDRISTYPDPVVVYHYTLVKYPGKGRAGPIGAKR
ncbi:hypothetical protein [Lysobacter capsici]|nr:hypothetical protein [Lysobacter capsici]WND80476.1 hypothetical protein RJ610_24905 [Lysobacter capsici]WND85673.1 hypothetical protein RJ609_24925 [Lysobacter capsici]